MMACMAGVMFAGCAGAWAAPEGVAPETWSRIAQQLEVASYDFRDQGGRALAWNRAQDFRVAADRAGVVVADRLRFRAISVDDGTGAQVLPDAMPVSAGRRLEYRRGAVTEWYENRPEGLEQGFTIAGDRVQGSGVGGRGSGFRVQGEGRTAVATMALEVEFETELAVRVVEDGLAVQLKNSQETVVYRYGGLKVTDAAGRLLSSGFRPASGNRPFDFAQGRHSAIVRIVFDASGAEFPITVDPVLTSMEKKLAASDGALYDYFGGAVAAAGDVIVVGASYDDDLGGDSGSACVFERNAGGTNAWGQVKELVAPDGADLDYFGCDVAVAGDVIVAGAYGNDGPGADSGSAYVFERNAGGTNAWGQVCKLVAADGAASDRFGYAVAAAGDVIVVGAPWDHNFGGFSGSAYVFERNAGGTNAWGQVRKLRASDAVEYDYFGYSVAAAGDVIVAGAYGNDGLGADSGSAYVFERNAGGTNAWSQVCKLVAADGAASDRFGYAVGAAGDVIVVGAYLDDDKGSDSGSACVFEGVLFGPPTVTNVFKAAGACGLSFDCQAAWRYDLQWRTNLLKGQWVPAPGLTNLPGHVSGSLTVAHTNAWPGVFYRLLRH
jgi:hypothetical protein